MQKIVAIVGPTCSGKTSLGISASQAFNGEVLSADSRQVYTGLNIGSGKVTQHEMQGVPHHLLDVADPKEQYSVARFRNDALKAIADIHARNKLPILVGGTGQYIDAVLYTQTIPEVPPNEELRKRYETYDTPSLFKLIETKDPRRAQTIERNNRRRLVRALEIIEAVGVVPEQQPALPRFDHTIILLVIAKEELASKIHERLIARLSEGMIEESQHLHQNGLPWERFEELGLEYRYIKRHVTGELSYNEMVAQLEKQIVEYARRQRTWWRNRNDITPVAPTQVIECIKDFLEK
ncbi:MAG: tRNA (adenosine(37)-N6)-dimethylallyltransferase MiaA [bacterium]|nr:tRNA (adenosine(37)-N6)-dimethylallyltransferase MiaA [bacterium]